jgi:HK97 gp10 family phage protein
MNTVAKFVFDISGDKEIQRMFAGLTKAVQNKILRPAFRKGAKIVQADAKRIAPVKSGLLKSSIKVRRIKSLKRGEVGFNVITGKGDFKGETYYAAFLELGHKLGKRPSKGEKESNGDNRKEVSPKPFLRPAMENNRERVIAFIKAEIRKGVPLTAAQLAKQKGESK